MREVRMTVAARSAKPANDGWSLPMLRMILKEAFGN